jgi:hypothetical protein
MKEFNSVYERKKGKGRKKRKRSEQKGRERVLSEQNSDSSVGARWLTGMTSNSVTNRIESKEEQSINKACLNVLCDVYVCR